MAFPAYKSSSVESASQGNATVEIPVPVEDGTGALPSATDWQGAVIMTASSSSDIDPASLDGTGWVHVVSIFPASPDSGSGSSTFIYLEIDPAATEGQRQAPLTCSLTSARVWTAARVCASLPPGSAGRTLPVATLAETDDDGNGGTTHTLPTISTVAPDSLVIGFGGSDQFDAVGVTQSFTSFGDFTERVNETGDNAVEIVSVGVGTREAATPGSVGGTWTTETADECGFFVVVLDGVGSEPEPDTLRLYFTNVDTDRPVDEPSSMWDGFSASAPVKLLGNSPGGPAATLGIGETSTSTSFDAMILQFVTGGAAQDGQIPAGQDWTLVMPCRAQEGDADLAWATAAWVMAPDGTRRTQLFEVTFSNPWPASTIALDAVAFSITVTARPTTTVDVFADDKVVFEVGYRARNSTGEIRTGYVVHGGTGTAELQAGDTGEVLTERPAYLLMPVSAGLTFTDPAPPVDEPAVRSTSTGTGPNAQTHPVTLPAEVEVGDALLVAFAVDNAENFPDIDPSSDPGWVRLNTQDQGDTTNHSASLFWKRANGADALVVSTPLAGEPAYIAASVIDVGDPFAAGANGGNASVADVPPLPVPEGDYLSLLFLALDANPATEQLVTLPAGWQLLAEAEAAAGTNAVSTYALESVGLVENTTLIAPGTIGYNTTEQWIAFNVAFPVGAVQPGLTPGQVLNIGTAPGQVHMGVDVAEEGAPERVLYPPSTIAAGLDIDPEFTVADDGEWVQHSVRADGPRTSGTQYPRSEQRPYFPGTDDEFGFDPHDGQTHWMRTRVAWMEYPAERPDIVAMQLHSGDGDIVQVRTELDDDQVYIALRTYDPDSGDTTEVGRPPFRTSYTRGDPLDLLSMIHRDWYYIFGDDFTVWHYRQPVADFPVTEDVDTYFEKTGAYLQFNETHVPADTRGTVNVQHVQHFHTGWHPPTNYFGIPETDPGPAAETPVGVPFVRTGTATGDGILEHKWAILDGPTSAGTVIGNAETLDWTPTVEGDYVIIKGARNAQGWSSPAMLDVTVTEQTAVTGTLDATLPAPTAALQGAIADTGTVAATLPLPTASVTATATSTGTLAGVVPLPGADLDGTVRTAGVLAAQLPAPTASLVGVTAARGLLTAAAPLPAADLAG
ncbi:hypothetical protein, partial [Pseudonocardia zijingensis]